MDPLLVPTQAVPTKITQPDFYLENSQTYNPSKQQNELLPWQRQVPTTGLDMAKRRLAEIEGGTNITNADNASAAAKALFNANTSAFSQALSTRAKSTFSRDQSSFRLRQRLRNIDTTQKDLGDADKKLAQIDSMRKVNFAGQLKFADAVANYQRELEASKMAVLGGIIQAGLTVGGFMLGGPAGAMGGAAAGGAISGGIKGG